MLLTYIEFYIFVNTPGARLAYTLMCDSMTAIIVLKVRVYIMKKAGFYKCVILQIVGFMAISWLRCWERNLQAYCPKMCCDVFSFLHRVYVGA